MAITNDSNFEISTIFVILEQRKYLNFITAYLRYYFSRLKRNINYDAQSFHKYVQSIFVQSHDINTPVLLYNDVCDEYAIIYNLLK